MSTITLRIDDEEKKRLDSALENIGMNISTFYAIYTKRFLADMRIPFDIRVNDMDPFYGEENQTRLKNSIERLENGKGKEHDLIEVD